MTGELKALVHKYQTGLNDFKPMALATVLRVAGSSYRLPGARMLITEDGDLVGSVSGGCLERNLIRKARFLFQDASPGRIKMLRYDTTEDGEERETLSSVALGCQGVVDLSLEILPAGASHVILDGLAASLTQNQTSTYATVVEASPPIALTPGHYFSVVPPEIPPDLRAQIEKNLNEVRGAKNKNYSISNLKTTSVTGQICFLLERITPPNRLVIFGASHDAVALATLGQFIGWHVTVVDTHSAYTLPERFFGHVDRLIKCEAHEIAARLDLCGAFCAVVTHNYFHDLEILKQLLPLEVSYIGLLGPKKKGDAILADLQSQNLGSRWRSLDRLYSPAGFDVGGDGPHAVALAMVTEALAVHSKRNGGFLRDRPTPIHERDLT